MPGHNDMAKARQRGPIPRGKTPSYSIRLSDELTTQVERWRKKNDTASLSEALRALVRLGLRAAGTDN